jgi:aerobic C4-dicarboxylate transport protein
MGKLYKSLFGQVVIALVLGIVIGAFYPALGIKLKPLGDGFIKLIRMLIPAIVFCVVVHGISGTGDLKKVGRVGVKAIIYFELITTLALALGITLAYLFKPGAGMNVDPRSLDAATLSSFVERASQVKSTGTVEFLLRLVPATVVSGFVTGDVLQVLLVSLMFGCALSLIGEPGAPIATFIERLSHVLF